MLTTRKIATLTMLFIIVGFMCTANSQECYRSDACPGTMVCMDTKCVDSPEPIMTCEEDYQCEYERICLDGYCKLMGVACQNAAGYCYMDQLVEGCTCRTDGFGYFIGGGDLDPDDMSEEKSDGTLYAECQENLISVECEEEGPDVEAVCTPELKRVCTDYLLKEKPLERACRFGDYERFGKGGDVSSGDSDTSDDVPEADGGAMLPEPLAWEPFIRPWELADCCEIFAYADQYPDYVAAFQGYVHCISELSDDDCYGRVSCEELVFEEDTDDVNYVEADSGSGDSDSMGSDSDESGSNGCGCSIIGTAKGNSLLSVVRLLFSIS